MIDSGFFIGFVIKLLFDSKTIINWKGNDESNELKIFMVYVLIYISRFNLIS